MKNGEIYYIDFSGNKGSEINDVHLGLIFAMPNIKNMVFCIPLTSPRKKHFKNLESFNNRNYLYLKYQHLIYLKNTDSIALRDQMRCISIYRLIKPYGKCLDNSTINLIIIKATKYLKNILKKQKI